MASKPNSGPPETQARWPRRKGGGWWRRKGGKVVETEVEGGPWGSRGGHGDGDRKKKPDFCGECWSRSCGASGCHRSDRCESRWRRQLVDAVRRLVRVCKGDSWIASKVRGILGQVRRPKQPGPAALAVEVMELPRPRPKDGGGGDQASIHAIAEERTPVKRSQEEGRRMKR